ncbi:MAG: hypothetical protein P4M13_06910 [Alphaproteobacteria bacterium]|nr:hypothetical protein [Alphaproteobacteria bacterium]
MTEPENIMLQLLRGIRADMAEFREETRVNHEATNAKIGTLAQSIVGLQNSVEGIRGDVRLLSLAIDEHTQRLDRIEHHLGLDASKH